MLTKRTFFIIDDDGDDVEFFREAIEKFCPGAKCHSAGNGEEGLEKLKSGTINLPDFIFLDLNMPLADGRTCLKKLKADKELQHIPVIIFTTSSNPKDKVDTRQMGAEYFLTKPVSFKKLFEELVLAIETIESKNATKKA
jgi:CheY-like chemotaxis protein